MTEISNSQLSLLRSGRAAALQCADDIDTFLSELNAVPYIDRTAEMPVSHSPDQAYLVARGWDWWPVRGVGNCPAAVTGLTIHHTMSHSPLATARYCTKPQGAGGKGCPTIQYHFWISAGDGCPVFLLADPSWALWHDHTGTYQTTLSIGMAGSLHKQRPPDEQIAATARLCAYLMDVHDILVGEVRGHTDRAKVAGVGTVCPGWYAAGWARDFYEALGEAL